MKFLLVIKKYGTSLLKSVYYFIHHFSLRLTRFDRPSSHLVINAGSGISWNLNGAGISLTGTLHFKYKVGL